MMASNAKQLTRLLCNLRHGNALRAQLVQRLSQRHTFASQSQRCITATNRNSFSTDVKFASAAASTDGGRQGDAPPADKYSEAYRKKMGNYYSLLIGSLVGMISSGWILYNNFYLEAQEASAQEQESLEDGVDAAMMEGEVFVSEGGEGTEGSAGVDADGKEGSLHKSEAGFKERKIIEYENRIRAYSTPDKIFRYFASLLEPKTGEIYMNPEDFVRALTPDTMQPKGLGLDQFKKFDKSKGITPYVSKYFGEESIFHSLGEGGLISFSDYIFLLTVLGTSARHIDIAFKMFDLNGDGEVSLEEFKKVRSLFLNMTSTGSRHRDRKTTGNVLHDEVSSGLATYFFGKDGLGVLTSDKFIQFKRLLQEEVMYLEFNSFTPKNDTISERQFAEILLTYANFQNAKRNKIIKRIKTVYGDKVVKDKGVKFSDYLDFFSFLLNIRDVEMALSFHTVAGQPVDKATFKQVAKTVASIELRDHLVDIVFCVFDENEDGELSNKEFVAVMKDKMFRGLNKPKDTGFTRLLSAMVTCGKLNVMESFWFTKSDDNSR